MPSAHAGGNRPHTDLSDSALIQMQRQQALVRLGMSAVVFLYIAFHSPAFATHLRFALVAMAGYTAFNLLCIPWAARQPRQRLRMLLAPFLDTALAATAMWMDGGIGSPAYILLFVITIGNGVRYGNAMMFYSQMLGILALAVVGLMTVYNLQQHIDWLRLLLLLLGIAIVPGYAHILGKRLEQAIVARRQAEEDSIGLLEFGPMAAFTFTSDIDGATTIRYANQALGALLGLPPETLAGEAIGRLTIAEDAENIRDGCRQALQRKNQKTLHQFEIRCRAGDGEIRSLICRATAIRWRGEWTGLCMMDDVTENERLHEQLECFRQRDYINSLLAGLTHDFRNVLTHIIGNAEIMQLEAEKQADADRLQLIIEAGERGSEMISQLLQMARRQKTPKSLFRLQETLPAIIRLAHLKLPEHIALEFEIDDDLPPLFGHAVQIDQVVLNLIENASHAVGDAGYIHISVHRDAGHALATLAAPAVRICVEDNGCGIAGENIPHVFDAFWTSREKEGGSGLGLTMAKRIVAWHRGEITLSSVPGEGTMVTITLPPAGNKNGRKAPPKRHSATTSDNNAHSAPHPWRVLLVDDDENVLNIHRTFLEHLGMHVVSAGGGIEALNKLKEGKGSFDLVMTDYHMPEMDGLELSRKIRELEPKLPIMMVTAFGEDAQLQNAPETDFGLLAKPVNREKLAAAMAALQHAPRQTESYST